MRDEGPFAGVGAVLIGPRVKVFPKGNSAMSVVRCTQQSRIPQYGLRLRRCRALGLGFRVCWTNQGVCGPFAWLRRAGLLKNSKPFHSELHMSRVTFGAATVANSSTFQ